MIVCFSLGADFLAANVTERAVHEYHLHAAFNLGQEETILRSEDWKCHDAESYSYGDNTGMYSALKTLQFLR